MTVGEIFTHDNMEHSVDGDDEFLPAVEELANPSQKRSGLQLEKESLQRQKKTRGDIQEDGSKEKTRLETGSVRPLHDPLMFDNDRFERERIP